MLITDIPHSPLPSTGRWPQSYLDDIHFWLATNAGSTPYDNVIINGDFDIDQRLSSGGAPGTTLYTVDRWRTAQGAGCTVFAQRFLIGSGANYAALGLPYEARSFLNTAVTVAPLDSTLSQRIESVNTLAGKQVVLSFFARWSGAAILPLAVTVVQNFGTGGGAAAPVTTVVSTFNIPAASANYSRYSFVFNIPTIEGKAIRTPATGVYDDYLELIFTLPAANLGTLAMTGVDLRAGGSPADYSPTAPDLTLARCLRFYQKSYNQPVAPGAITTKGSVMTRAGAANATLAFPGGFHAPLRAQPVLTLYSPATGAAGNVSNLTGPANIVVNSTDPSEKTWGVIVLAAAPAAIDMIRMQWVADAEL